MIYVVIFFLLVSIYLYCILGGADFGAGIIELFSSKKNKSEIRKLIARAIAPIWEANHMWLIIAVVVLFNAFPEIYTRISIALYIPIIFLLIGIVIRGTAFTFRHYDAFIDGSQEVYSNLFSWSSLAVSFGLGLVVGAITSDKIFVNPPSFYAGYIHPWLNLFSISVGAFTSSIFTFTASSYLIGDIRNEEEKNYVIKKSKVSIIWMVVLGALVFVASLIEGVDLYVKFFNNIYSILLIVAATLVLPITWRFISKGKIWLTRIAAGTQVLFIIAAFYAIYFPAVVRLSDSKDLTLLNSAAPAVTLKYLGYALLIGSLIIFPILFYLLKIFKGESNPSN